MRLMRILLYVYISILSFWSSGQGSEVTVQLRRMLIMVPAAWS